MTLEKLQLSTIIIIRPHSPLFSPSHHSGKMPFPKKNPIRPHSSPFAPHSSFLGFSIFAPIRPHSPPFAWRMGWKPSPIKREPVPAKLAPQKVAPQAVPANLARANFPGGGGRYQEEWYSSPMPNLEFARQVNLVPKYIKPDV